MDLHSQLKYPPRTMTRKGESILVLSPEGRTHVDQVVKTESRGKYLELSTLRKERLAVETGVSIAQIQNYLRNKHQSLRTAQAYTAAPVTPLSPAIPATTQNPLSSYLPIKAPPEDARKAKELLLFGDIPESKLDRLSALLHLAPEATESEAEAWAEPLELPENRVLAWFRYQRKSSPPKPEEVDDVDTPRTLIKHELSPEPSVSDRRSSLDADSPPMGLAIESDQQQEETQASRPDTQSRSTEHHGQPSPFLLRKASLPAHQQLPANQQLPTPTSSTSASPDPSEGDRPFAQQQAPSFSPSPLQTMPELEDGEIIMGNMEGQPGSSSLPMVRPVATSRRDSASFVGDRTGNANGLPVLTPQASRSLYATPRRDSASFVGDRTGNSFPVLTPQASRSQDAPSVSSMQQLPCRGGAPNGRTSWDVDRPSHSRQSSWEGSSSRQQQLSSRKQPPWPYRDYGKGKGRERLEVIDQREGTGHEDQLGVGPHRSRPKPLTLHPHPYSVHSSSSSHRPLPLPSASTSDASTPSTSRSSTISSSGSVSVSPPLHRPDSCRIIQAVTMALKDLPAPSVRMDVDSYTLKAVPTTEQNVERIQEFNSWALGAARSLGVSLQARPSQGPMPPPPNPPVSPTY